MPAETGFTFSQNAVVKAETARDAVEGPALADDSGIEAAALDGAPGVRSARYAGESATDLENLERLDQALRQVADRRVRYVCVLAFARPGASTECFVGVCEGVWADELRGGAGFGYDPGFVPTDYPGGRTMAELSQAEKDAISHRGRAARAFLHWLAALEHGTAAG